MSKELKLKGNWVTHITTFMLGILTTYTVVHFSTNQSNLMIPINAFEDNSFSEHLPPSNNSIVESSNIPNCCQIMDKKDRQIARLKVLLSSDSKNLQEIVQQNKIDDPQKQLTKTKSTSLKKMTFKDFEDSMKVSFTDQFKGIVIELSGDKLDDLKNAFSQSDETNEQSIQYENAILNFLAENNASGDHFINSLRCNTHICRLEVNTNDNESWSTTYAAMTQESWYASITIQEESDYPGNIIYYLPRMNN